MALQPKRIAVSGAAGQICYSLLFRLANGDLYGPNQPVILHLLEITPMLKAVQGVVMELQDCAFPLLAGVVVTDDARVAFRGIDAAILVGARPRSKGMERSDLLAANAAIFRAQGEALNEVAGRDARVLVVGNPANTNAYILSRYAPDFPAGNISSMIRLDHNRALTLLAEKAGCGVRDIERLVVWGNHSPTMFADWNNATLGGKRLAGIINDETWYRTVLLPTVAQRGAAVIEARGLSSAASAANAAIDQLRDWLMGTNGRWMSMAVPSDGSYGIPKGLMCGVPVVCEGNGRYRRITDAVIDDFGRGMIDRSVAELVSERDAIFPNS